MFLLLLLFFCNISYANDSLEKIDNKNFKLTKVVTQSYNIDEIKLQIDNLNSQIDSLDKYKETLLEKVVVLEDQIKELKKIGVE